jgi:hypothetical protein
VSAAVERYEPRILGGQPVALAYEAGQFVRFADVEEALKDAERFEWLRPVFEGSDDGEADRRSVALGLGLVQGLSGRELVDWARVRCGS